MSIDIETYALAVTMAKAYVDAIIAAFPKGIHWLGDVDYYSDLPSNPSEGDAYTVKYTGTSGTEPDGTEYAWGINQTTQAAQWIDVGPDMSQYQKLLVSGTNIKTLNGNSILGAGNMIIASNREFPSSWSSYLSGTTKAFCDAVNADSTAVQGMSYLGEVTLSDLPASIVNAEIVVEIMDGTGTSGKVIHLVLTSGNVSPYRWEYTYWNDGSNVSGWIAFETTANKVTSISAQSTDTQYPTAKCVYDIVGNVETLLAAI